MAEEHGALLLALEHRFYGDSINPDGLKTENLADLSSQQALVLALYQCVCVCFWVYMYGCKCVCFTRIPHFLSLIAYVCAYVCQLYVHVFPFLLSLYLCVYVSKRVSVFVFKYLGFTHLTSCDWSLLFKTMIKHLYQRFPNILYITDNPQPIRFKYT